MPKELYVVNAMSKIKYVTICVVVILIAQKLK